MPFIVDDAFYDDPDVCGLPDCSVAFLMLAGPWSARNSRSGFVPSSMLARLSSDPELVTKTLRAAGLIWLVDGGVQIASGRGLTVVNAADVEANKARVREDGRERAQRFRDRKKAGQAPTTEAGKRVTRYEDDSSRVTPQIDRSDQDQSIGVSQVDVRAREPDLIRIASGAVSKLIGRIITAAEAEQVIAVITERAGKAGTVIRDPEKYYPAAIKREPDVYRLLLGDPPPVREIVAELLAPAHPDAHPYEPGEDDRCARCQLPEGNRNRHPEARAAV